jgi:hypothetical protein
MKQSLKKTNGIYILFRKEAVVYVGSSKFCESRIYDHLDKDFTHFEIKRKRETGRELRRIEARLIGKYIPEYNQTLPCVLDFASLLFIKGSSSKYSPWSLIAKEVKTHFSPVFILNGVEYFNRADIEKGIDIFFSKMAD